MGTIPQSIINRHICNDVNTCGKLPVVSTFLWCKTVSSNCCTCDETSDGGSSVVVTGTVYSLIFFSLYYYNTWPFVLLGKTVVLTVTVESFLLIFVMSAMSWYHVLCVYQYVNGL